MGRTLQARRCHIAEAVAGRHAVAKRDGTIDNTRAESSPFEPHPLEGCHFIKSERYSSPWLGTVLRRLVSTPHVLPEGICASQGSMSRVLTLCRSEGATGEHYGSYGVAHGYS